MRTCLPAVPGSGVESNPTRCRHVTGVVLVDRLAVWVWRTVGQAPSSRNCWEVAVDQRAVPVPAAMTPYEQVHYC